MFCKSRSLCRWRNNDWYLGLSRILCSNWKKLSCKYFHSPLHLCLHQMCLAIPFPTLSCNYVIVPLSYCHNLNVFIHPFSTLSCNLRHSGILQRCCKLCCFSGTMCSTFVGIFVSMRTVSNMSVPALHIPIQFWSACDVAGLLQDLLPLGCSGS